MGKRYMRVVITSNGFGQQYATTEFSDTPTFKQPRKWWQFWRKK